ncbi:MAG: bifunctional phosphopantothenoylcysteine decarboxylase/phosphopantothenate--cysteine ligase CoaBC [Acidimicrobiales bacterium]
MAGRRVVLGVSGGIAAYKAVEVCRLLMDAGAFVSPVLTADATRFVGALTFSALASEPARTGLFDGPDPIPHTRLGQQADLVVVAPATARVLGAYAAGISSDLLVATLLATRAPVVVCPAMHTEMWEHPAVVDNLELLARRGVQVVAPGTGRLAGGDSGPGRLAEPADIVAAAIELLRRGGELTGVRALVTAGGTREPIDPVRFVGNRSSGKQGHAIAAELVVRGAEVTLVTAAHAAGVAGAKVVNVETAAEMETAVLQQAESQDLVVMAAAVADFRPKAVSSLKLKKSDGVPEVVLEPTTDILAALGRRRRPGQVLVGFAAETVSAEGNGEGAAAGAGAPASDQLRAFAESKLADKGADLIVANDVSAEGTGFGHDTNAVWIVSADREAVEVPLADKRQVATAVVDAIVAYRGRRRAP